MNLALNVSFFEHDVKKKKTEPKWNSCAARLEFMRVHPSHAEHMQ